MNPKILLVIVLALLVIPSATAISQSREEYTITGGLGSTSIVTAYLYTPSHAIPKGESFYAALNLYSDDGFNVTSKPFHFHGGCTENHRHTNRTGDPSYGLSVYIDMNDADVCSFHFIGEIRDSGGDLVHTFQMVSNVEAYNVHELGQDPATGWGTYWLPLIFFLFLLYWAVETGQPIIVAGATIGALIVLGGQFQAPVSTGLALMLILFSMIAVGLPKAMRRGLNPFRRGRE